MAHVTRFQSLYILSLKEVGTYKEMISSHLDVCLDVIVPCPNSGCGANIKLRDITSHHSVCPDAMVPCPNNGCGADVKRKDMHGFSLLRVPV